MGTGYLYLSLMAVMEQLKCPACRGYGKKEDAGLDECYCDKCNGTGVRKEAEPYVRTFLSALDCVEL